MATLSLLALLSAAGFLLAWLELRMSRAHRVGVQAFYAADGALASSIAGPGDPAPPGDGSGTPVVDSLRVVSRTLLLLPDGTRLRMHEARASRYVPGGGAGRRSVARLALGLGPGRLPGALTAPDGATGGARISGLDAAPPGACPGAPEASRAALAGPTADGGSSADEAPDAGTGLVLEGTPPRADLLPGSLSRVRLLYGTLADGEAEALGARTTALPPWPSDPGEEGGEPPALFRAEEGAVSGPGSGAGLLLATGDLRLEGPLEWEGLVLVGGTLRTSGEVRVRGAVVTGLEATGGGDPSGDANLLEEGAEIRFDGCALRTAVSELPLPESARPGAWWERI